MMQKAGILFLNLFLAGCGGEIITRPPACEPPPIPAPLLLPCEEPELLADGRFATLYKQEFRDLAAWQRCAHKDDKLVELVKYRDAVCAKIKADAAAPRQWWQF